MTLTYELLQRDFYEALVAHRNRSAWTKWFLRFMVLVLVLAIGSVVFGAILVPDLHFAKNNAFSLLLLGAFWTFFLWGQPWLAAKNQFGKQPSAQGPRTMSLDDGGTIGSGMEDRRTSNGRTLFVFWIRRISSSCTRHPHVSTSFRNAH